MEVARDRLDAMAEQGVCHGRVEQCANDATVQGVVIALKRGMSPKSSCHGTLCDACKLEPERLRVLGPAQEATGMTPWGPHV